MITTKQLCIDFKELITHTYGKETEFGHTCSYDNADAVGLIFIQTHHQLDPAVAVVVTTDEVANEIKDSFGGFIASVTDVRMAQALMKQAYDDYPSGDLEWPQIHASAVIHPSAVVSDTARIGPNVVIGKEVVIGHKAIVRSNSVIEFGTTIGEYSIINSSVVVGHGSVIGRRVILQSGCVIGAEGYGFAQAPDKHYERIPHTGNVVIEDDVFIGGNCCVDRGTYGSTLIKRGVKMDNLCHVAHNVELGEDVLLIGQSGLSGSSKLGDRVIAAGQTGVLDHKEVAADTVLVHRAGVIEDIPTGGMWGGFPAKPFREHTRRLRLDDYVAKRFAKLEAALAQLQAQLDDPSTK